MDINQLITDLQEISQKNSISHYKRDRCAAAATALSTLQAENAEMQKQLNEFSKFLSRMTGGLLSKTNYTEREMTSAALDYQQKECEECDVQAENEKLREQALQLETRARTERCDAADYDCRELGALRREVSALRERLADPPKKEEV